MDKDKRHYTIEEQVEILLEQVIGITDAEAVTLAGVTSCWTFLMIKTLRKALKEIGNGKQLVGGQNENNETK